MTQDPDRTPAPRFMAFSGPRRIAAGALDDVAVAVRRAQAADPQASLLVFDGGTGRVVDLDLRGTEAELRDRYAAPPARRGRPRLGVTAREVTLLPRHWDWLAAQPGGASAALRRLIDAARKLDAGAAEGRMRVEAAHRLMTVLAGDRPGYEEAVRALFAGDRPALDQRLVAWPADVSEEVLRLLGDQS